MVFSFIFTLIFIIFLKLLSGIIHRYSCAWANRKRCELLLVFWSGKWLCANGEKQEQLSFPASFSLVHFFWRSKRTEEGFSLMSSPKANEHYLKKRVPLWTPSFGKIFYFTVSACPTRPSQAL